MPVEGLNETIAFSPLVPVTTLELSCNVRSYSEIWHKGRFRFHYMRPLNYCVIGVPCMTTAHRLDRTFFKSLILRKLVATMHVQT